ncbi:MAG: major capsid protein [Rhodospirillaceae bacterium]|nr:major capsid protein [Rhodospirillaceae bacterium]
MDIYSTGVLTRVVSNLILPQSFFLDRYFGEEMRSDTAEISFDIDTRKRRLAPFVSPLVQGKVVAGPGFQTSTFKPAYVKDKRMLDPMKPVKRALGEAIGGTMSAAQREEANLAINMEDQIQMLVRRQEHMAIDALLDGITVVSGEGYAPVSVNFGRHADLSVALLTTARWGESGVSPADDVESGPSSLASTAAPP